uniref:Uncharacterized protein n=1 Tax=Arundo donax TaxID=35708 RepID=A0A0A9GUZ3_ARUDO
MLSAGGLPLARDSGGAALERDAGRGHGTTTGGGARAWAHARNPRISNRAGELGARGDRRGQVLGFRSLRERRVGI